MKKLISIPVLAVLAGLIVGGVAIAAVIMTMQGTVTVVAPGTPGGGGTPPPTTYLFKVYDAATAGNEIAAGNSAFFDLGSVTATYSVEKTVYIEKTGTGDVTVTPSVTGLLPATGTITFTPTSVLATSAGREAIVVKFTAAGTAAPADPFDITFTGSP